MTSRGEDCVSFGKPKTEPGERGKDTRRSSHAESKGAESLAAAAQFRHLSLSLKLLRGKRVSDIRHECGTGTHAEKICDANEPQATRSEFASKQSS